MLRVSRTVRVFAVHDLRLLGVQLEAECPEHKCQHQRPQVSPALVLRLEAERQAREEALKRRSQRLLQLVAAVLFGLKAWMPSVL